MAEWEYDLDVVWSDVTGICKFWDGSCRNNVWSLHVEWYTIHSKFGPVPGGSSL